MSIPESVQAFLSSYDPAVQRLALRLRDMVLAAAPDALEEVDRSARLLGYTFSHSYSSTICVIMPLKAGVDLGFARGAELPDPSHLLAGTGKRARHVKITGDAQIDAPALRVLLDQAVSSTPR